MTTEWCVINLPWWCPPDDGLSFSESPLSLNKPGILVELKSGKTYLIGDINEKAGACDCCQRIKDEEIVTRYKVIWDK